MPKAKPLSLFPLTFDEALKALVRVDPVAVGLGSKRATSTGQRKRKPNHRKK
jgi:hypothetical protein